MIRWAFFWFVLTPALAWGADAVILFEAKVPQYRAAAAAAKAQLPGAIALEPTDPQSGRAIASAKVVVVVGQKSFDLAQKAAPPGAIVYCMVLGVQRAQLGARTTGVPLEADPASVLVHIRALLPGKQRVGLVYDPSSSALLVEGAQKAAAANGLTLVLKPVKSAREVREAVIAIVGGIDVLWVPPDPRLFSKELFQALLSLSSERKLPLMGFLESLTRAGALASVSPDYEDMGKRAGKLAADVLNRGSVPPLAFSPGTLSVNLKTANALGLDVPPPALSSASEIIR